MAIKKVISLLAGLGETTLSSGMNTCKKTINKIGMLMVNKTEEQKFDNILKSALKPQELFTKESLMKLKEKLLTKNEIDEKSERTTCSNCGLTLPPYCIFCLYCGAQLFDDIFYPESKKSPSSLSKTFKNLLDFSFHLDNLKLLVFLLQKVKTNVIPLTRCNYRI